MSEHKAIYETPGNVADDPPTEHAVIEYMMLRRASLVGELVHIEKWLIKAGRLHEDRRITRRER